MEKKEYFTTDEKQRNTSEKTTNKGEHGLECNAEKQQNTGSYYPNDQTEHEKLEYTLKNDYMFKAVFQTNKEALKELIAALLDVSPDEIRDIKLENPIILGESVNDKTVILDMLVTFNDGDRINIEMQVRGQECWPERSTVYICRNFVTLNKGETYDNVKRTIHVGIIDFDLPIIGKELYAKNKIMNEKTHEVYCDRLELNVLSLRNIKYATENEKKSNLYQWAKIFAAKTWEELKMAATTEAMKSSVVTIRKLTAEERIRMQCEARERQLLDERTAESLKRKALAKARQAESKAQQAESKAQQAEERTRQAEEKFKQAEARIRELERLLAQQAGTAEIE